MKNLILTISAILFSLLFYQQNIGLNLFLFSIVSTVVLIFFNPLKFKEKETILKASIFIIASAFVFMHHSFLAFFTSLVSFIILVGTVTQHKSSIYIKFINGLYTTIVGAFPRYFERTEEEKNTKNKHNIDYAYWLKIIGIPLVVVIVFVALYRNINPIFNDLIAKIDFSFINLSWLLFTAFGYYLFYNISTPIKIEPATQMDLNTDNFLHKINLKQVPEEKTQNENQLGIVLMVLLNALLVFLIVTDLIYLNQQNNTVSSTELKTQLHQSVNALIVSIMLAMSIIIYFFRGNLNFFNKNKVLKYVTFIWIILNIVMIFITIYKNYTYITSYGITYKRIGVYIYLFLTFSGLVFTFIKVSAIKNIVFLFRKNIQVAFVILVCASTINWDIFITNYNLNNNHNSIKYLLSLSNKNAKLLKDYADKNELSLDEQQNIQKRYIKYTDNLNNNSWQEKVYQNFKKN